MIAAVHDPRSVGVAGYVGRLAAALSELGIDYRPAARAGAAESCHFHLANSTRRVIPQIALRRRPFLLTIHDVLPRTRALVPLQRTAVMPLCARRATAVIVHSRHAATMLTSMCALDPARLRVIPLPAHVPACRDRDAARRALGLSPDGPPLFVVPGALRAAKLVDETLAAAAPLMADRLMRLLFAGAVGDEGLPARAAAAGATLLRAPDPVTYERAIVAADAVVSLRADSVGESNGPLLEAIGAARASLVSDAGSAPEVAGPAALVVRPEPDAIAAGLRALLDPATRERLAAAAAARARELAWSASARAHAQLLAEVHGA